MKNATDRVLALGAAEIHQRSRRELGPAGMAKAEGHVNPQNMIALLTGCSRSEAKKLDGLGRSIMQAVPLPRPNEASDASDDSPVTPPWHAAISARMIAGEITPDRFEALHSGLGEPTAQVSAADLAAAAQQVLSFLHPEDLPETVYRDSRAARALIDREGVAERENEQYTRQQAKVWRDREGMVHLSAVFAPEDGTFVKSALDLLLGPRIGGPRLADKKAMAQSQLVQDDPRTIEQLTAGALVALVRAGAAVEHGAVLAKKRPAVQIVVTASELTRPDGDGIAFIEGTGIAVTMKTVDRLVCDTGYQPVVISADGSPLDLGREHRLFQPAQRLALNAVQGGCVWPGCEKPPSFCEIHHIEHWHTGGKTDIHDGVLLCKHHHLLLHSNGWRIHRDASSADDRYENRYWLTPPRSADPRQRPRRLRFSGAVRHNPSLSAGAAHAVKRRRA
ncbi:HNH endonuclease signature motif containing protein [Agreia sp. Leaf283]|uniref:HNH endonuclease signature motif containing protein n=1 Tax=Agreia sp. Leaf283 TaxID=1736321 RepID=UPI00138F6EAD|nr:HNH endonuclease signature motif containing protein [Agreia sp. Leaf283]